MDPMTTPIFLPRAGDPTLRLGSVSEETAKRDDGREP
jgi:hypothetical protein